MTKSLTIFHIYFKFYPYFFRSSAFSIRTHQHNTPFLLNLWNPRVVNGTDQPRFPQLP